MCCHRLVEPLLNIKDFLPLHHILVVFLQQDFQIQLSEDI